MNRAQGIARRILAGAGNPGGILEQMPAPDIAQRVEGGEPQRGQGNDPRVDEQVIHLLAVDAAHGEAEDIARSQPRRAEWKIATSVAAQRRVPAHPLVPAHAKEIHQMMAALAYAWKHPAGQRHLLLRKFIDDLQSSPRQRVY